MRARLLVPLLLCPLLLSLLAPAVGAKGPAKVTPTLQVIAAKLAGKKVLFTVLVSFAPSSGANTAACRGKVILTEKVKPHHQAPHWGASLGLEGQLCEARVRAKLPARFLDDKVAFKLTFPGNGDIAPFSAQKKLKLSAPRGPQANGNTGSGSPAPGPTPPAPGPAPTEPDPTPPLIPAEPYTAADGGWSGGGEGGNILFEVKEGVIQANFSTYSSVLLTCEEKDSAPEVSHRYTQFQYRKDVPLGQTGAFSDEYHDQFANSSTDGEVVWAIHGQLGASTGTMVLEAHDGYFNEHFPEDPEYTVSDCHLSITFGLHKG